jgi:hypothetical protein
MQKQSKRIDVDPPKADRVTSSPRQQAYSIPFKEQSWLLGNRFQRNEKIDLAPQIQKKWREISKLWNLAAIFHIKVST